MLRSALARSIYLATLATLCAAHPAFATVVEVDDGATDSPPSPRERTHPMRLAAPVLLFSSLTLLPLVRASGQFSYHEDFTTETYKDAVETTADWNTGAGALQMFPFEPSIIGSLDTPDRAWALTMNGNLLYLADYSGGLQIIDVYLPNAPVLLGSYDSPGQALYVVVDGDIAYLADDASGVQVVDVSDSANPVWIGNFNPPGAVRGLYVHGDYLYVGSSGDGLRVLDVSTPASPTLVATLPLGHSAYDIWVEGDIAYVTSLFSTGGLDIVDVSNPTSPSLIAFAQTSGSSSAVHVAGDYAFVADRTGGVLVFDVSDPSTPTVVANPVTPGSARDLWVEGDWLYVATDTDGLRIFDITDPAAPVPFKHCDTPGSAQGIVVGGTLAYLADEASGLQIIGIQDSSLPIYHGSSVSPSDNSWDFSLYGNRAFIAGGLSGLTIAEISYPSAIHTLGNLQMGGDCRAIAFAHPYAYVSDSSLGLAVVDALDPTNPTLAAFVPTGGTVYDIELSGNYAYLANGTEGLQVVDISDPLVPAVVGLGTTTGIALALAVAGNHAFVATSLALYSFDISNPTAPVYLDTYSPGGLGGTDVELYGDLALMPDGDSFIRLVDISIPASMSTFDTRAHLSPYEIDISGDLVFVSSGIPGVALTSFRLPYWLSSVPFLPSDTYSFAISGDYVFTGGDPGRGFRAIRHSQAGFETTQNKGQSLIVHTDSRPIIRARLNATQTGGVSWYLSADNGWHFQQMTPGASWDVLNYPGYELVWRTRHFATSPHVNSSVTELQIEWLHEGATITSISDVPNDQGKQVLVEWIRSGYEIVGDPMGVGEYAVYRKIDRDLASSEPVESALVDQQSSEIAREHAKTMLALDWEFLMTVPARNEDHYAVTVPTLADSTVDGGLYESVFMVSTLTSTPGLVFDSPPDSGFSVDNLAPAAPQGILASYAPGGVDLEWADALEEDFRYYRVYRGLEPDFVPSSSTLLTETASSTVMDPTSSPWRFFYKISAVDFSGNEGPTGMPATVTGVVDQDVPLRTTLHEAVPNPFNPRTTLSFTLAHRGHVRLAIYDLNGRLVNILLDEVRDRGRHEVAWDGTDSGGSRVASRAYFFRMQTGEFMETNRMTLLK